MTVKLELFCHCGDPKPTHTKLGRELNKHERAVLVCCGKRECLKLYRERKAEQENAPRVLTDFDIAENLFIYGTVA